MLFFFKHMGKKCSGEKFIFFVGNAILLAMQDTSQEEEVVLFPTEAHCAV